MTTKTNHGTPSALDVPALQTLVEQVQSHFSGVVRLTAAERSQAVKLKRGAHQVLPLIAQVATKYAVQVPGASLDDMTSNLAYAQSLEPLLGSIAVLHETVRDAHMSAQGSAWRTGVTSYGMMKRATKVSVSLTNELAPIIEWFRQRARGDKGDKPDATPVETTPGTTTVPAPTPAKT